MGKKLQAGRILQYIGYFLIADSSMAVIDLLLHASAEGLEIPYEFLALAVGGVYWIVSREGQQHSVHSLGEDHLLQLSPVFVAWVLVNIRGAATVGVMLGSIVFDSTTAGLVLKGLALLASLYLIRKTINEAHLKSTEKD